MLLPLLLVASGCGRGADPNAPQRLYNRRGRTVALDAADWRKAEAALEQGRADEFAELVRGGRFFAAPNGTEVTVLERQAGTSKIRIIKDGREGYVPNDLIK